jgi:hypothetical protein
MAGLQTVHTADAWISLVALPGEGAWELAR